MIRKNLARIFHSAATRLESDTTKETAVSIMHATRVKIAAFIMPDDAAFTITPEQRIAE